MEQEEISFSDFIASSVHDMKNSLSMQIGSLEKIAIQCQQNGDISSFNQLGHMIYEANRMNGNLIQILSLYKLGKSIYPVDISEQSVREVLTEVVMQNSAIMDFKGIAVTVACDEDCYWYFDRDLITGVLINALNNAYNYTTDKIRIAAQIDNGFLEMRVEDNGKGYPASMLTQRVDAKKGINFTSGSTGLGFYFSSRVANMHKNANNQGVLKIENGGTYGGGCFIVRLP